MKRRHRHPKPDIPSDVMAVKLPPALAEEIRRRARDDDRTVSQYLRRVLSGAVKSRNEQEEQADATTVSRR